MVAAEYSAISLRKAIAACPFLRFTGTLSGIRP